MEKQGWHIIYKETLMQWGISHKRAQASLEAGMDGYDYSEDPEDCAMAELSYWAQPTGG